jgi:hypothetical protein
MKAFIRTMTVLGLALVFPAHSAFAQEPPVQERPAQDRPAFRQEQLDQMLASIALHPDPLLSQILMAATYPLEVVQAARWSRANPGLKGEAAVKAVESMDWDPSVKSLVAFPEILAMMNEHLQWTQDLGEAFLAQQAQVMDTIQALRRRAEAVGNLEPDERRVVRREDEHIVIEPPEPGVVHVPYYDPRVVYGSWWWPAYQPVYWGPPVGYYAGWGPYWWGPSVVVSSGFFFGAFRWPHRHVVIVHFNRHRALFARRGYVVTARGPVVWRHDVFHRRGVPYRQAVLRQEFRQSRTPRIDARRGNERAVAPRSAPATRSAPGERTREPRERTRDRDDRTRDPGDRGRESRDRRSQQRIEPAPRQSATASAPRTTPRAQAPAAARSVEARRSPEAPAARPRSEAPRVERNIQRGDGAAAPRFEEDRRRQRAVRARETHPARRAERPVRQRAVSEERRGARHSAPRARAVSEDRSARHPAARPGNHRRETAPAADRSGRHRAEARGAGAS